MGLLLLLFFLSSVELTNSSSILVRGLNFVQRLPLRVAMSSAFFASQSSQSDSSPRCAFSERPLHGRILSNHFGLMGSACAARAWCQLGNVPNRIMRRESMSSISFQSVSAEIR